MKTGSYGGLINLNNWKYINGNLDIGRPPIIYIAFMNF